MQCWSLPVSDLPHLAQLQQWQPRCHCDSVAVGAQGICSWDDDSHCPLGRPGESPGDSAPSPWAGRCEVRVCSAAQETRTAVRLDSFRGLTSGAGLCRCLRTHLRVRTWGSGVLLGSSADARLCTHDPSVVVSPSLFPKSSDVLG